MTRENVESFRRSWRRVLGGSQPENRGSQRLLAAAAKGELHDRALWTPLAAATGAAGNSTALVGTLFSRAVRLLGAKPSTSRGLGGEAAYCNAPLSSPPTAAGLQEE